MSRLLSGLAVLPLVLAMIQSGRTAELEEFARVISVTGQGTVSVTPDVATVQVGVVTQAAEASEALTQNSAAVARLLAVLKDDFNIAAKDLQTSNFSVNPQYDNNPRRGNLESPKISSYMVSNQVSVKIRQLTDLGKLLDAAVRSGGNRVFGITFGVDDPSEVENQARRASVKDARARAELFAEAAGVKLGRVVSISEQSVPSISPRMMGRAMMASAERAVPVESGEQQVEASIQMIFEVVDTAAAGAAAGD